MSSKEQRRLPGAGKPSPTADTTADSTPSMVAAIRAMRPGNALDQLVVQCLQRHGQQVAASGLSTTWEGARQVASRLTALGCYLEMQLHADTCLCRVLRALEGNAVAKQLGSAPAPNLPEAVAKATIIACIGMQPPAE